MAKLVEFTRLAAQCMEIVRANDTGTLQYDIYFNDDQSECIALSDTETPRRSSSTLSTWATRERRFLRRDRSPANSFVSRVQTLKRRWAVAGWAPFLPHQPRIRRAIIIFGGVLRQPGNAHDERGPVALGGRGPVRHPDSRRTVVERPFPARVVRDGHHAERVLRAESR